MIRPTTYAPHSSWRLPVYSRIRIGNRFSEIDILTLQSSMSVLHCVPAIQSVMLGGPPISLRQYSKRKELVQDLLGNVKCILRSLHNGAQIQHFRLQTSVQTSHRIHTMDYPNG